jgi:hypothetical protein
VGDEVIYCAASASCDRGRRSYRLGDRGAHSEPAVRAAWAEEPLGRPGFDLARCAKRGSRSAAANQRDRYGRRHEPAARVRQRVRDEFRWAGFATDLLGVYGSFQCNRPGMVDERGAHEHAKDPAASDAAGSQLYQHVDHVHNRLHFVRRDRRRQRRRRLGSGRVRHARPLGQLHGGERHPRVHEPDLHLHPDHRTLHRVHPRAAAGCAGYHRARAGPHVVGHGRQLLRAARRAQRAALARLRLPARPGHPGGGAVRAGPAVVPAAVVFLQGPALRGPTRGRAARDRRAHDGHRADAVQHAAPERVPAARGRARAAAGENTTSRTALPRFPH